jgi:hypothetical protein
VRNVLTWGFAAVLGAALSATGVGGALAAAPPATPQGRAEYVAAQVIEPRFLGAFRIFGQQVYRDLPPPNAVQGMKAMAGVGLEAPVRYFGNVLLAYGFFDDPRLAQAYFAKLDMTDQSERTVVREESYTLRAPNGEARKLPMRCVVVPGGDYSLNCHVYDAKTLTVLAILMGPGPVDGDRRSGELPLQTAFRLGGDARVTELVPVFMGLIPRR